MDQTFNPALQMGGGSGVDPSTGGPYGVLPPAITGPLEGAWNAWQQQQQQPGGEQATVGGHEYSPNAMPEEEDEYTAFLKAYFGGYTSPYRLQDLWRSSNQSGYVPASSQPYGNYFGGI